VENNDNNTIPYQTTENSQDPTPQASEIEEFKKQVEKLQNDYLYLKAEFENYKKRVLKEKSDLLKYGSESLIIALLDLVDNFDRALSMEIKPDNLKSFEDGIRMLSTEFKNTLNRFGVTEVPAQGVAFDPNFHEALGTEPTTELPAGHITKVFSKPYKLHDRLVRPGRVIIASEPNKT
jgi:molecular chaperone GrpE